MGGEREEGREGNKRALEKGGTGWNNRELFVGLFDIFLFFVFCVCVLVASAKFHFTWENGKAHSAKKMIKIKMVLVKGHSL